MASPELALQLKKRLRKQNEGSPCRLKLPRPSSPLMEQILQVEAERDAALKELEEIQASSMRKGQQVAAEIARLRLQTAATQRSVALAEDEARRLRRQTTQRLERQRSAEEANERLRWATEQARQQKRQLEEEVKKALEEKERMTQQVEMLESMVSSQIRRKLDFQERLAQSRELEASQKEELARKTFSLHDADEATEGSDSGQADLEFSYDGLELCNLMPFERAFRLAKLGPASFEEPVDLEAAVEALERCVEELTAVEPADSPKAQPATPTATPPATPVTPPALPKLKDSDMPVVSGFALFSPYSFVYKYA